VGNELGISLILKNNLKNRQEQPSQNGSRKIQDLNSFSQTSLKMPESELAQLKISHTSLKKCV
jgi:hypothetical protein